MNLVADSSINHLIAERGTAIIYTHFAYNFMDATGGIKKDFESQMRKISRLNGWFVPVSTILDRFLLLRNVDVINNGDLAVIINKNKHTINELTILTNHKRLFLLFSN